MKEIGINNKETLACVGVIKIPVKNTFTFVTCACEFEHQA